MEMNDGMKEVYFDQYCETCEHSKLAESEEPCSECLSEPVNQYSHKPVKYEKSTRVEKKPVTDEEGTR